MIALKIIIALGMSLLSSLAVAGGRQYGQITTIVVRASDGLVYVYMSGTLVDRPSCSKVNYWMIRDENSAAGKKQLALLMMAQASNRYVLLTGQGDCKRWSDGEDIEEVQVTTAGSQ